MPLLPMLRRRLLAAQLALALAAVSAGQLAAPASAAEADVATCSEHSVPVIAAGSTVRVHGTLCKPSSTRTDTVIVLIPGTTYNEEYWDFSVQADTYNFRRAMNRSGRATFTIDRVGTGRSTVPPSVAVTASAQAEATHGVVQALREGLDGPAFERVVLGGHSLGSVIAVFEAATYRDVDAVLLTGFTHFPNLVNFALLVTPGVGVTPAKTQADPALRERATDLGYVTTLPFGRNLLYASDVSPEVREHDEATKDISSLTEIATAFPGALPLPGLGQVTESLRLPPSAAVVAPVLLVTGEKDKLLCTPLVNNCRDSARLLATERPFYPLAATLEAQVIPQAGHDLNLSIHAPQYQRVVLDWLDRAVQ